MSLRNLNLHLALLWMLALYLPACQTESEDPIIPPSEFSKSQREELGDRVKIAIAFENEQFPVIPNIPPYDESVYWFIQTLYNQVTNTMRIDNQSPSNDRWDLERNWEVIILDLPEKNAFIVPGGHLYLTTGLLKSLRSDHELYYILAFEASLMNEKYLLRRLISDFNTSILANIANGTPSPNGTTSKTVAEVLSQMDFDENIIPEIDEITGALICQSSRMNRMGILPILGAVDESWVWLNTRKSYIGRSNHVLGLHTELSDCGSFESSGGYQEFVLDHLPR
ncbi:MAG: M48 family metalloprotease [Bacteroidota bacterium]